MLTRKNATCVYLCSKLMKNFYEHLKIIGTAEKGRGVISSVFIPMGSLVSPANGAIIPNELILPHHMCLQTNHNEWLCSEGCFTDDYFNHSCNPNIGFLHGTLHYYALRDIPSGEELCWDYSTSISEKGWTMNCRCGQPDCRKIIRSYFELETDFQNRLFSISLDYIRKTKSNQ